ncbi:ABC transporter permease [Neorhizobium alkalisoli]|jgi:peptide/nickel transport system permease protein|uniref:Peptide/nickel transport system permease protein n=1 Tax=Neorhizobium alkalisoli TaxID=528178 RepID=A0A561R7W5_9HYPH|nr:ABC transporter permease [Neorhizobium alkalisoli]TWF58706.1 peptide/nickel transport system permease protein [Neorhizobium alkalisoli]
MSLAAIFSRVAGIVITIFVIATINFVLVRAAPGDPAAVIAGQSGATDEKFLAQVRAEYGLDQPYVVQLGAYLGKVATLDLGYSYRLRRPVKDLIAERLGPTLLLTLSAFLISLLGGVVFGALAGVRHGKISDLAISLLALILYATPVFWFGLMLVLLFSIKLEWLPAFGYVDMRAGSFGPFAYALDVLKHLCLPALTLGAIYMAMYARLMRASVIEVAAEDYIKTARAKGLTEGAILRGHMLRNASLPVITFAGLQVGAMIGGAVVVETVFSWPGLGRLIFDAVTSRDYPVLLGLFLVMSILVIAVNLLTDLIHRLVDPRLAVR